MAVRVTQKQLAEYQRNLAGKSAEKLYPPIDIRTRKTVEKPPRFTALKTNPTNASPRTRNAAAITRRVGYHARRVNRAVRRAVPARTTGGIGTLLVLIIGTGVVIAVIRNPAIVITPLRWLGTITQAVMSIAKGG